MWLAENLCLCSVAVAFVSEMLPNVEWIRWQIVRCDLHRATHAVANIFNEEIARNPVTLSDPMRQNQFRVRVDCRPQPEIAAPFFRFNHPASVASDILPLLIKLDSQTRKIAKVCVHVIGERFARL